jgi:hypothetical protein
MQKNKNRPGGLVYDDCRQNASFSYSGGCTGGRSPNKIFYRPLLAVGFSTIFVYMQFLWRRRSHWPTKSRRKATKNADSKSWAKLSLAKDPGLKKVGK